MSEKASTYLTIMSKNDLFSFLGLVGLEMVDSDNEGEQTTPITAVVKLDPREGKPIMREYPTRSEAVRQYREAITTSESRGWLVVYRGQPIWG